MKHLLSLIPIMFIVSCATQTTEKPEPKPVPVVVKPVEVKPINTPTCKKELTLWSTYYYSPSYKSSRTGYPVRDEFGKPMGPKLPHKEICNLMLQGSGSIDGVMFGYAKPTRAHRINCDSVSKKITGTLKFKRDGSAYGIGVLNIHLRPFKSIAVDRRLIPYRSKLFIPKLKGIKYNFEGKAYVHDGIVEAHDTGSAIKGNHIDFFIGPVVGGFSKTYPISKPFTDVFVKSKSSGTFKACLL